jgi:polyketide synthase PksN
MNRDNLYYLIPISAKTGESLTSKLCELRDWLKKNEAEIGDIAYTLSVARNHFAKRIALRVHNSKELEELLEKKLSGENCKGIYEQTKEKVNIKSSVDKSQDENVFIDEVIGSRKKPEKFNSIIEKIADQYILGYDIDWAKLYQFTDYHVISLPTYPFLKEKHWISFDDKNATKETPKYYKGFPLIGQNQSDFFDVEYSTIIKKSMYFVKDHIVGEECILPGVVYLEMASEACQVSLNGLNVIGFRDVQFLSPVEFKQDEIELHIKLDVVNEEISIEDEKNEVEEIITYEIFSLSDYGTIIIHSKGNALLGNRSTDTLKNEKYEKYDNLIDNANHIIECEECYDNFAQGGLNLGYSFKSIQKIYVNEKVALSKIQLPKKLEKGYPDYVLHPTIMDGALETAIAILGNEQKDNKKILLPAGMGEIHIYDKIPTVCYSIVEVEKSSVTDDESAEFCVKITDLEGNVCVIVRHFCLKKTKIERKIESNSIYFEKEWKETPLRVANDLSNRVVIVFDDNDKLFNYAIDNNIIDSSSVLVVMGNNFKKVSQNHFEIDWANEEDYQLLLTVLLENGKVSGNLVYFCRKFEGTVHEIVEKTFSPLFFFFKHVKPEEKMNCICAYSSEVDTEQGLGIDSLNGFLKTVYLENRKITGKVIKYDVDKEGAIWKLLISELGDYKNSNIRYEGEKRFVQVNIPMENEESDIKELEFNGKNCLITGGAGGIGTVFAQYFISKNCNVILCGKSKKDSHIENLLEELNKGEAKAVYYQADICDKNLMLSMMEDIHANFGSLNGIVHCAGVQRDSYIINKSIEDFLAVVKPKVFGTMILDEVTSKEPIDYFVMCSSIAAVNGNSGQADYAYANSFMDGFANYRNKLMKEKLRKGNTLSINWSLWKNGGMQVSEERQEYFSSVLGIDLLSNEIAMKAFEYGIKYEKDNFSVFSGNREKITRGLGIKDISEEISIEIKGENSEDAITIVKELLIKAVAKTLKIDKKIIQVNVDLGDYGISSVNLGELTDEINVELGIDLTPADFYSCTTIDSYANFVIQNYEKEIASYCQKLNAYIQSHEEQNTQTVEMKSDDSGKYKKEKIRRRVSDHNEKKDNQPIAIVGMDCKMPMADNLEEYWKNLLDCKDTIIEVPDNRWNAESVNNANSNNSIKEISRWGGFMNDVDTFDAMFFGISPREAVKMDPQQRMFMETVWKTIEDAGYRASYFSGSRMGLFVGVATEDYSDLTRESGNDIEAYSTMGLSHCILANRISYFFNWTGPSEPVNTACSSSLVAIHRAIQSIRDGECDTAIAGGVNVMVSPTLHISFSKGGMLSEDGHCKTFDKKADGYVRGEGVGAVLLKKLDQAIRDGDHIYAVIRGSAVNHGGHATSLTAPNPVAQCNVIQSAYANANVDMDRVSYIEAHGTGTSLGDPVEINALKTAFGKKLKEQSCGIGTVKTNIGHLEAAAGIAGVIKTTLSLQRKMLPGIVNFKELNPYIKLKGSPFYIVENTSEWKDNIDENGDIIPKIAGVSSFGFGGVNAHIVLQEYVSDGTVEENESSNRQVIVLSARTDESLLSAAQKLRDYIQNNNTDSVSLESIAYTLQVGREEMSSRLAFVCSDTVELVEKLNKICLKVEDESIYFGNVEDKGVLVLRQEEVSETSSDTRNLTADLDSIAKNYVKGTKYSWEDLHDKKAMRRISLPTYSFKKERFWLNKCSDEKKECGISLAPVIDENVSTLFEQKYRKRLTRKDLYLSNHVVFGQLLLPGVAYLEMVAEAGFLAAHKKVQSIYDVVWVSPVILDKNEVDKDIYISIKPHSNMYGFEIYSIQDKQKIVHTQGKYSYDNVENISVDFGNIIERCPLVRDKHECYHGLYKKIGFDYGEFFQVTQMLYGNENEIFAELELNGDIDGLFDEYILHPALFDGGIRAIAGRENIMNQILHVPYSAGKISIFGRLTEKCYSYARVVESTKKNTTENMTFQIYIFNEKQELAIAVEDFMARPYRNREVQYYIPSWEDYKLISKEENKQNNSEYILLCNSIDEVNKCINVVGKDNLLCGVMGAENYSMDNDIIYMNSTDSEQVKKVFSNVVLNPDKKLVVVNCLPLGIRRVESEKSINKALNAGAYTALAFVKTCLSEGIEDVSFITLYRDDENSAYYQILEGMARSIRSITDKISLNLVGVENEFDIKNMNVLSQIIQYDLPNGKEIKIQNGKIFERKIIKHINNSELGGEVVHKYGNYIISGGTGMLGRALSSYLAEMYHANIILVGQREVDKKIEAQIEHIRELGGNAEYFSTDLSSYSSVEKLVNEVKKTVGNIHGIINLAGKAIPERMDTATREMIESVFIPKILGTVNLDRATQKEKLDFFMTFSSVSSEIGDMGSGSYAMANTFMDRYSFFRAQLEKKNRRYGKTISINWPLWKDGGMDLGEHQDFYVKYSGMELIDTQSAFTIIEQVLRMDQTQVIPAIGVQSKIEKALRVSTEESNSVLHNGNIVSDIEAVNSDLYRQTQKYLSELIGRVSGVDSTQINPRLGLDAAYGIDSMLINELNGILENDFSGLPKTIFFECQTLQELTDYFVENYEEKLHNMFMKEINEKLVISEKTESEIRDRFTAYDYENANGSYIEDVEDIAIIGISGKYPKAKNIDEFWEVLKNGEDCIEEIPNSRWDKNKFFDQKKRGYIYSKWGGFIDDVDKFDSLFFNISPREADYLDPQERLFLETAWETMEDAGYCAKTMGGTNTGVFVGVMWGSYQLFGVEESLKGNVMTTSTPFASMANRVSYCLNLSGPSLAIDTMCSSSLTAIHMACESIRHKECDMAFAGGVNITVHPDKYLFLCRQHFLSTDGRCRSFGDAGDGYVPGEGVGAVLLKPLKKALADNDHIYAIIKGSAANHGGKTNGYSVPNPKAQTNAIIKAIEGSKVPADTISYVETHGTGTALGDPIEIRGLQKGFNAEKRTDKFCAIGSVKSNIGHLEAAAGVASVTKVVLQMQHKMLVPSIHSEVLNKNIDFESTPFYVQRELQEWNRKKIITESGEVEIPLRAGISSFGAGGSNVHIVLEEFNNNVDYSDDFETKIVILSAKNWQSLESYVEKLEVFVERTKSSNTQINLEDIAYTLQKGRDEYANRVAFVVSSLEELSETLRNWKDDCSNVFIRKISTDSSMEINSSKEYPNEYIEELAHKGKFDKIAELWINGANIEWDCLYKIQPHKVSLPTYPFTRTKHWYPKSKKEWFGSQKTVHPLVDKNVSTFYEEKFEKKLHTNEFFIQDHVINGQMILPGVAYLEMVRAAAVEAAGEPVSIIKNATWIQTIKMDTDEKEIDILLEPNEKNVHFSVCNSDDNSQVYFDGHLILESQNDENGKDVISGHYDIDKLKESHTRVMHRQECYQELYKRIGFEYGPSFQVTDEILIGENSVLAKLTLPESLMEDRDKYLLHPSLLDGAVRAIAALDKECSDTYIPFGIGAVTIYSNIKDKVYAYATVASQEVVERKSNTFNISVLDEDGNEVVKIKDFTVRKFSNQTPCILLKPQWIQKELKPVEQVYVNSNRGIIVCDENIRSNIELEFRKDYEVAVFSDYEKIEYFIQQPGAIDVIYIFSRKAQFDLGTECINNIIELKRLLKMIASLEEKKQVRCIVCTTEFTGITMPEIESTICVAKSASQFSKAFEFKVIQTDCHRDYDKLHEYLTYELNNKSKNNDLNVRWENNCRYERSIVEVDKLQNDADKVSFKSEGVYIISGGFGRIGIEVITYLSQNCNARLIVLGRSSEDEVVGKLKYLRDNGNVIDYFCCDMSNRELVDNVTKQVISKYGHIDGVIYLAGIMDTRKADTVSDDEFCNVLLPKTAGIINLDKATEDKNLDFFFVFSSISSELGDMGAISYSAGNTFIDRYCSYRHETGYKKIFAANWPVWKDGGMQIGDDYNKFYTEYLGMQQIETQKGLSMLSTLLEYKMPQIIPVFGNKNKILRNFHVVVQEEQNKIINTDIVDIRGMRDREGSVLFDKTQKYLLKVISDVTHTPIDQIYIKEELSSYGVDSVVGQEILEVLDEKFEEIPRTLLFEVNDITSLTEYFVNNYEQNLSAMFGVLKESNDDANLEVASESINVERDVVNSNRFAKFTYKDEEDNYSSRNIDIAIIGIDGKYPMANDLFEFWNNLKDGKNCIQEIPTERWDYRTGFNPNKGIIGKYYSKWGGFIDGVDEFDPEFFKLTPKDAEYLDPQERLFLENAYHTFEDAGYTIDELSKYKVGVFVGVMYSQYQLLAAEETLKGNAITLGSSYASIANRVSYYFNLKGPSMAIDTMCSSSLTAIHLACESIWNGETDMALAGGVNVTIHPDKYAFLSAQRFASSEGLCRAFGEGGDGYVPSEGVGAVLLKPLDKAERDGDLIYSVIKGSAIGHGGRTNGYTVPNPAEQEKVIKEALKKSKVDPNTITYIEAHGTGTSLGDPIEIAGLTKSFGSTASKKGYCSVGSVKSNIGHCEGAAGIASVTKVVLQMLHHKLVPSIHSDILNSKINFESTPFYVQRDLAEWKHPMRAGVSSFGAGGSNVHLIMEEYMSNENLPDVSKQNRPCIIVLSAINEERLKAVAIEAIKYLKRASNTDEQENKSIDKIETALIAIIEKVLDLSPNSVDADCRLEDYGFGLRDLTKISETIKYYFMIEYSEKTILKAGSVRVLAKMLYNDIGETTANVEKQYTVELQNLAYTLQIGRKAFKERLAVVVESIPELIEKLSGFVHNDVVSDGMFVSTNVDREWKKILFDDEEGEVYLKVIVANKKYDKIAQLWTMGIDIKWSLLYDNLPISQKPHKISAFKYPFAKERYWVPNKEETNRNVYIGKKLSSLIDVNESDLGRISFRKSFSEYDMDDYTNYDNSNFGAFQAIMIGMVVDAAVLANRSQEFCGLGNVVFYSKHVSSGIAFDMIVNIYDEIDTVSFEICVDDKEHAPEVYMEGEIYYKEDQEIISDVYDIDKMKKELLLCSKDSHIYENMSSNLQWLYSNNYSLGNLYWNEKSVLINLNNSELSKEWNFVARFVIDAITGAFGGNYKKSYGTIVSIDEVECCSSISQVEHVLITKEENNFSAFFIEKEGAIAVAIHNMDIIIEEKTSEEKVLEILEKLKAKRLSVNMAEEQLSKQFQIMEK